MLVGFVSSQEYNYTLFTKILYPVDVYVFPIGMIQFHANAGKTNAVAITAAGSENLGFIAVGDAVFGSNPPINSKVLEKAFALDGKIVKYHKKVFSSGDDIVNE
ncbi:Germin-like protein subfamily 1 member 3 [Cardamine amara subsp. amara]|uniref:Germin-like protein n=1 Tax=Cardamine amara subsp. amara TaxID=228776 RepID=A0ABD0YZA5_CARAN